MGKSFTGEEIFKEPKINIIDEENSNVEKTPSEKVVDEIRRVLIETLLSTFALDAMLFKDKDSGNIQTHNNAKKGVFVNDDYKGIYERNQAEFSRKELEDKRQMTKFRNERTKDGYTTSDLTGKKIEGNKTHVDHNLSLKGLHEGVKNNPMLTTYLTRDELKAVANANENLAMLEASANQSKGALENDEFLNKKNKDGITNRERYEVSKEKEEQLKKNSKKTKRELYMKAGKRMATDVGKESVKAGANMAIRQSVGYILTEIILVVNEELPKSFKKLKENFNIKILLLELKTIVVKAFNKVKEKYKEVLTKFKDGFLAGIMSTISTTLINLFATTVKRIVGIVRQVWGSLVQVGRIILNKDENMTAEEKTKAILKVLTTMGAGVVGKMVSEALDKPLKPLPGLADFIGLFSTGILTAGCIYFIENSQTMKKILKMLEDFSVRALKNIKDVNKDLARYIAQFENIDYDSLYKELNDYDEIATKLSLAKDSTQLYAAMTEIITIKQLNLPFKNIDELDDFMDDDNAILKI